MHFLEILFKNIYYRIVPSHMAINYVFILFYKYVLINFFLNASSKSNNQYVSYEELKQRSYEPYPARAEKNLNVVKNIDICQNTAPKKKTLWEIFY